MKLSPLMYERVFFCPWLVDKERDGQENGRSARSATAQGVKRQEKANLHSLQH